MPIQSMSTTPAPGSMIHRCAACGAEHRISFDRGAQKARTGPAALAVGDTLIIGVDADAPVTVTFAAGDFPDFARVTAAQLAAKVNAALAGVRAVDDVGGLLIESETTGPDSRIQVVGGTARAALGFATDGRIDPCHSRPVLGISRGAGQQHTNIVALRRCNDCGANECLVRTFEATAPELDGTHFKEHRKAVNALAEHCKARGWSHPDTVSHHAAETARPVDIHDAFPDRPWALSQVVPPTGSMVAARREGAPQ